MPKQAAAPPIGHFETRTAEVFQFDDMSSIHPSIIDVDEEQQSGRAQSYKSHVGNNSAVKSNSQFGGTDISERLVVARRKNVFMIVTLILFIGIVAAIAVAMALAMQNKPIGADSREADQVLLEEEFNSSSSNAYVVHESDNFTSGIFETETSSTVEIDEFSPGFEEMSVETAIPTYNPTPSPTICIPLELGIIFDNNANQTEWKILKGADGTTDNEVAWQSTSYDATTYDSKAVTHQKCLPPQMYTFVFTDSDARSYVLSSEGNVIVTGMSIDSKNDILAFELPFEVPEPVDKDGDGVEDRLGTLMPYDSSGLEEGIDCEPFRLELQTDDSGVETLWRLYEGQDNSGEMIADGGPFASNSNYVYEYCLKSPNIYTFYIYDWASDGLCCVSGEGYFMLTTGDEVIVDSTGEFGGTSSTTFTLPTDLDPSVLDSLATPSVSISITPSAAPSVTPKKQPNNKPSKEATITPTEGNDPKKENQA